MNTTEKLKTLRDLCAESETPADASDAPYQAAKRKTDRVLAPFAPTNQSSKVAIDNAKEQLADTTKRYMTARHSIVVKRYVIANE